MCAYGIEICLSFFPFPALHFKLVWRQALQPSVQ
jgi:hypothetical protein